jgi:hypothetical protein
MQLGKKIDKIDYILDYQTRQDAQEIMDAAKHEVSDQFIVKIKNFLEKLDEIEQLQLKKLLDIENELKILCVELEKPYPFEENDHQSIPFEDAQNLLFNLRVEFQKKIKNNVDVLASELTDLWEKCKMPQEQRIKRLNEIGLGNFLLITDQLTVFTRDVLLQEHAKYSSLYERFNKLEHLIQDRIDLILVR